MNVSNESLSAHVLPPNPLADPTTRVVMITLYALVTIACIIGKLDLLILD
jgi:hypothetical protein